MNAAQSSSYSPRTILAPGFERLGTPMLDSFLTAYRVAQAKARFQKLANSHTLSDTASQIIFVCLDGQPRTAARIFHELNNEFQLAAKYAAIWERIRYMTERGILTSHGKAKSKMFTLNPDYKGLQHEY